MEINILWKLEKRDNTEKLWYVDFEIASIDGVFRVANSDGIDLDRSLDQIFQNCDFFRHVVDTGVSKVFKESATNANYGGGWEWRETKHPKLATQFLLGACTSWFTCPFGGRRPDVRSMDSLYPNLQPSGITLLHSWSADRQPSRVCYFFPNQPIVE
jgi:hypothetical protein